jgi:hypothetical protein
MWSRFTFGLSGSTAGLLLAAAAPSSAQRSPDLSGLAGLEWRNVGPYRGGRATTIAGVPGSSVERLVINAKGKTFQDVINFRNGLNDQSLNLAQAIDGTDAPVTAGVRARFADLEQAWIGLMPRIDRILGPDVDRFNQLVRSRNVPAILVPAK